MKNIFWLQKSCLMLLGVSGSVAMAQEHEVPAERPNILWLTFEDTSSFEFGCYGNNQIETPTIDRLAEQGIQFMNAWSVAPQSSAARSSLITGCYATTYGMDVHPVAHETPQNILFPQLLRDAGYYCTNNSKTHYNTTIDNKSCWDECSKIASYNSPKRKANQPFFAVFNTVTSHMGRIRTFHTDGRRDYRREGIDISTLKLPKHLPDLPEIRSDFGGHLEAVQDVDQWVSIFLQDLKRHHLDENTIIFVFSDHGGCLPRGKGYLYETGLRVPLIAYFPKKWAHLAQQDIGTKNTQLVDFTDLGPTVLSIAGVKPASKMQGKALYGKYKVKEAKKYNYGLGTNQLHNFLPNRAITDGRYKLLRSYIPYRQFALRNYYQWGMPSNKAWDAYILSGKNENPIYEQPYQHHEAEMLFDLKNDPWELHNLAHEKASQAKLVELRNALNTHIKETKDLGFFLPSTRFNGCLYDDVRQKDFPLNALYHLANTAGTATRHDLSLLKKALNSPYAEMRFWACVGYAHLGQTKQLKHYPKQLKQLLADTDAYVASEAAYAIAYLGNPELGIQHLVYPTIEKNRIIGYSALDCISMDTKMRRYIRPFMPTLRDAAAHLPRLKNEDAGLMARGILVNMGELNIKDLHGPERYKDGLRLNRGRRGIVPLPFMINAKKSKKK